MDLIKDFHHHVNHLNKFGIFFFHIVILVLMLAQLTVYFFDKYPKKTFLYKILGKFLQNSPSVNS